MGTVPYATKLMIITGQSNGDRQSTQRVIIQRNINVSDTGNGMERKNAAYTAAVEYARSFGLGVLLDEPGALIIFNAYLGVEDFG